MISDNSSGPQLLLNISADCSSERSTLDFTYLVGTPLDLSMFTNALVEVAGCVFGSE